MSFTTFAAQAAAAAAVAVLKGDPAAPPVRLEDVAAQLAALPPGGLQAVTSGQLAPLTTPKELFSRLGWHAMRATSRGCSYHEALEGVVVDVVVTLVVAKPELMDLLTVDRGPGPPVLA